MFGNFSLDMQLKQLSGNIFNMVLFNSIKTGNPFIDTCTTTALLTMLTYLFQFVTDFINKIDIKQIRIYHLLRFFKNKSQVEYEGKISSSTSYYENKFHEVHHFSDRFKALWAHIIENVGDNKTVKTIKEYSFSKFKKDESNRDVGVYMVVQNETFLISEKYQIYAYTTFDSEIKDNDDKISKGTSKIEKIKIDLFSYHVDVQTIKDFAEGITNKFLASIQDLRENKRYIYTLINNKWEENMSEMWSETVFNSTRTFNNIFFEEKELVKNKLDFFLNNKDWYYEMGIPYSIGIGLHGPPGTGKTSLIKAIANYTKRHIISISLKQIKTKKQLDNVFFEERYNTDNKKGSVTFDKKIIVFEDIDCIGDIVLRRGIKKEDVSTTGLGNKLNYNKLTTNSMINVGDLLETIATNEHTEKIIMPKMPPTEEPITLDDILNLWDGIRETPGRIMIISSNHYYDLDPALIRPGRIDITMELSYASRKIIGEMFQHFFKRSIDETVLTKIEDKFYSPAEIVNIYLNHKNDYNTFLERLLLNKHV